MTKHFYAHALAKVCYYKFGSGAHTVLCFHGLGMHGKQFHCLADELGSEFTFYGFDLFFHKDTELADNSLENIKYGLQPELLATFIKDFCDEHAIEKFSIMSYSMGTFYGAVLLDQLPQYIERAFFIAPSFLKVKPILSFLSSNKLGNLLFEKLALSENGLHNLVQFIKTIKVLDGKSAAILWKEVATPQLRFNMYANLTYLRHLKINVNSLSKKSNSLNVPLYFIFGKDDKTISSSLSAKVIKNFTSAKVSILDQGHDLIHKGLTREMLFCEI
ncbi:2-succinyl-6-hydroxy-2,4-cyclohexadiene-1-carboxylate synthase [compost metagenome]